MTLSGLPPLPTFTIPTNWCSSLLLPLADIAEIMGKPMFIQVGIGEAAKSIHLVDLNVSWLHAPPDWPVLLSGFNPGNPAESQVFQYDVRSKQIQVDNCGARVSLGYEEIFRIAKGLRNPGVSLLCLPVEGRVDARVERSDKASTCGPTHDSSCGVAHDSTWATHDPTPITSSKLKRKVARQTACLADAQSAASRHPEMQLLVPTTSLLNCATHSLGNLLFVQIPTTLESADALARLRAVVAAGASVVETNLAFKLASEGILLDEQFSLIDLKNSQIFTDNRPLIPDCPNAPRIVQNAAAHSRSYIHHLFRCGELSGPILLATVNLWRFQFLLV